MRAFRHRYTGAVVTTSDNPKLKPWRQQISETILYDRPQQFAAGVPVKIALDFFFARPKSAKKRRYMTVKPDYDKLLRAVMDALKGVVLHDDAQVIEGFVRKHYGEPERVEIQIEEAQ